MTILHSLWQLSYRDLAQIMGELGVSVGALSTIIAGQGATEPRTITLDGFKPSHAALRRMGMRNEFNYRWENPVNIRSCQYLNNIVEQDHRRIKRRVQPMLGFKKFYNARRVIMGIELMQMLHKDNSGWPRSELLSRCNRAGAGSSFLLKLPPMGRPSTIWLF